MRWLSKKRRWLKESSDIGKEAGEEKKIWRLLSTIVSSSSFTIKREAAQAGSSAIFLDIMVKNIDKKHSKYLFLPIIPLMEQFMHNYRIERFL